MSTEHSSRQKIILILALVHFIMSIIIHAAALLLDISDLLGGIGAASPLMCFMALAFCEEEYLLLNFILGALAALTVFITFIVAVSTRKYAVYSIGVIVDVIVRAILMIAGQIALDIALVWTGLIINLAVFIAMMVLNKKKTEKETQPA